MRGFFLLLVQHKDFTTTRSNSITLYEVFKVKSSWNISGFFFSSNVEKRLPESQFSLFQTPTPHQKILGFTHERKFPALWMRLKDTKRKFLWRCIHFPIFGTTGNMLKLKRYRSLLAQKFTWLIIFHSRFEHQAIIKQLKDVSQPIFMLSVPCFNRIWRR